MPCLPLIILERQGMNFNINHILDTISLHIIQLWRHAELRNPTLPNESAEIPLSVILLLGGYYLDLHKRRMHKRSSRP